MTGARSLFVFCALLCALLLVPGAGAQCIHFQQFKSLGKLQTGVQPVGTLEEVSGVEMSRTNEGVLWMHDDKGAGPYLMAVGTDGKLRQQYLLSGANNLDWEDIAIGPGPQPGRDYIYIGDFGNNNLTALAVALLRVPEPKVPPRPGKTLLLKNVEVFLCQYPQNRVHDAETLFVDPRDGTPYILTKETGKFGFLYGYPLPLDKAKTKTLFMAATFSHQSPDFSGGDVSPDGRWIHARNDKTIYTWPRADGKTFGAAFQNNPCVMDGSGQGNAEGLTVSPDGQDLYAVSEGKGVDIWKSVGTLPTGVVAIPSWWNYGAGFGGPTHGVPGLGMERVPTLGQHDVNLVIHSGRPQVKVFYALSGTRVPDGKTAFAGGWLNVGPMILFGATLDTAGQHQLKLGKFPNTASLYGLRAYAQAAVDDPTAALGIALSPGLTIQAGR
ncbi:MAG: hypothetical protein ACYTGW_16515 [Planctomycetota bacterium]|jgi:hypothetical protein